MSTKESRISRVKILTLARALEVTVVFDPNACKPTDRIRINGMGFSSNREAYSYLIVLLNTVTTNNKEERI
jgi:hypothetical protein